MRPIFNILIEMSFLKEDTFIAKQVISILVNLRYLRFKLLKYKENIRKFVILLIITSKIFLYI